jgi:hypothetical protein
VELPEGYEVDGYDPEWMSLMIANLAPGTLQILIKKVEAAK